MSRFYVNLREYLKLYRPFNILMDEDFMLMSIVNNFHKVAQLFELIRLTERLTRSSDILNCIYNRIDCTRSLKKAS